MDKTFIKMCREAKEIQDGWGPKSTDLAREFKPDKEWPLENLSGYECWGDTDQENIKNVAFWLPRQEDLQNIILDGFKGEHERYAPSPIQMTKTFSRTFNDLEDKRTLNELWLIFVMEMVFNKRWNGEMWEDIQ